MSRRVGAVADPRLLPYLASPIDVVPVLGWADDVLVALVAVRRLTGDR